MADDLNPPLDIYDEAADAVAAPVQDAPQRERTEPERRSGFQLVRAGELEFRPPRFLIRDYIEADSLALVFGDPGCGKSFLALEAACCIATGTPFHDNEADHGPVIYLAGEGHNGIRRRLSAWEIHTGKSVDDAPLFVSTMPAALCDGSSAIEVVTAVNDIATEHGTPALVVVDTLARNFGPGDENSTQDMGQFVQAADLIRSRHECTVLLVHHTGHADKQRARGAMALKGALDAEYRMDKDETGIIRLEATKMKDGPIPEPLAFRLHTVPLGMQDYQDQEITSAVLESTDYQPPEKPSKAGKGKWQQVALDQLQRLYKEFRETLEAAGRDPSSARVSVQDWRDACEKAGMDRRRFHDIKGKAATRGLVVIEHGYVRPV